MGAPPTIVYRQRLPPIDAHRSTTMLEGNDIASLAPKPLARAHSRYALAPAFTR